MTNELYPQHHKRKTNNLRCSRAANPYVLDGVDCRTLRGKKFRDIVDDVIRTFNPPTDAAIRELAGLRFTRDELMEKIIGGDVRPDSHLDLVRISNLISRLERTHKAAMRVKQQDAKSTSSLHEYLGNAPKLLSNGQHEAKKG